MNGTWHYAIYKVYVYLSYYIHIHIYSYLFISFCINWWCLFMFFYYSFNGCCRWTPFRNEAKWLGIIMGPSAWDTASQAPGSTGTQTTRQQRWLMEKHGLHMIITYNYIIWLSTRKDVNSLEKIIFTYIPMGRQNKWSLDIFGMFGSI